MSSNKVTPQKEPGSDTHSNSNSRSSTPTLSKTPSIKKMSSFASLSTMFKKSSNSMLPTSPKSSARRPEKAVPKKPPTGLNRQDLKIFLTDQGDNPSLEGVVRLGNLCFDEVEGKGLQGRSPGMYHHTALLLEWANHRNTGLLTPTEQKTLGISHYHDWRNRGIVAEVCSVIV